MQRWLVMSLVAACSGASDHVPTTHVIEVASFPATPVRELDLLFMIDDTTNADMENHLGEALEGLVVSLAAPDALPNLHVGVATSDLGTSGSLDPDNPGSDVGTVGQGGCAGQGDDGALQLSGADVTGSFVIDEDDGAGGRLRNYALPLHVTLGQMVRVGVTGCGFEQPLSAIRRALARDTGFVRPAASLAIVILADEDDCSVLDPGLFDPAVTTLGPLQSFRCTAQGVSCDEPMTEVGAKTNCRPRADSRYLEDPSITRQFLEELKPRPDMLTVSALVGPPEPVAVHTRLINGEPQTALAHGCRYNSPTGPQFADPAVRTAALVEAFGSRGVRETACQLDYAPSLARISLAIKRSLGVACIDTSQLADSLADPGIQPACEARDVNADGTYTLLPRCPAAGDCFEIVADPAACPETADHARIVVTRTQRPAEGARVEVSCEAPLPVIAVDAGVAQAR